MTVIPRYQWSNGPTDATLSLESTDDHVAVLEMEDGGDGTRIDINVQQAHAISDLLSFPSDAVRRIPTIPSRQQRDRDLAEAIEAIDEIMMLDKGDPDLAVWANRYLPLVKRSGRQPITENSRGSLRLQADGGIGGTPVPVLCFGA